MYGATKIYDALVKYGMLNCDNIHYLIDDYLVEYLPKVHNVNVYNYDKLKEDKPDHIIILARSATDSITERILELDGFEDVSIQNFQELLESSK